MNPGVSNVWPKSTYRKTDLGPRTAAAGSGRLQRLEKIMDEYCGGCGQRYMVNTRLMERGIELLKMLKEDLANLGADGLHQLLRAWELHHRVLAS